MDNYEGVIIEESLANKGILKKVEILSTKIEKVTEKHGTPWLSQWTLHTVAIEGDKAEGVAEELSKSFDCTHKSAWYADFKDEKHHYVIFRNKIFFIDRRVKAQYLEANEYGISLGIPAHQVDFDIFFIDDGKNS
jgi:hypothetical protein